jgi:hypothetical protein
MVLATLCMCVVKPSMYHSSCVKCVEWFNASPLVTLLHCISIMPTCQYRVVGCGRNPTQNPTQKSMNSFYKDLHIYIYIEQGHCTLCMTCLSKGTVLPPDVVLISRHCASGTTKPYRHYKTLRNFTKPYRHYKTLQAPCFRRCACLWQCACLRTNLITLCPSYNTVLII